jgi:hypothetical protein
MLTVTFVSGQPDKVSKLNSPFSFADILDGKARVSEHTEFTLVEVPKGETVFIDGRRPIAVTLRPLCSKSLWHATTEHDEQRAKHYFLVVSDE